MPGAAALVLALLLVATAGPSPTWLPAGELRPSERPAAASAPDVEQSADQPPVDVVAVVPNPHAHDDAGERLVLHFGAPTDVSGWTVGDGESVVRFPNRTLSGRVVATTDPGAVPDPRPNATVVTLSGRLALANAGETVVLRRPGGVLARVTYVDAPEGERYVETAEGWTFRTPGTTALPVVVDRDVPARLFVLPDAPAVPLATIEAARDRIRLAAYTFASGRIARALCAAAARGVDVRVLVEGEPVGGVSRRHVAALDRLVACRVPVAVLGGPGDRYGVHHAKYAVVDDRALVLSENWKPAGTGGRSSRGWGVLLRSPRVAAALATTFAADAGFRDARPWPEARETVEPVAVPAANGSYPSRFEPVDVEVDRVEVLVAPDNAETGVVGLLAGAERSVRVQQVSTGGPDGPFTGAMLRAARRGVRSRLLLSSTWYVAEENRRLVDRLGRTARTEGLPLAARLLRPRSRFEKSHVKGVVVDGEAAAVGSLNWNARAARRNREVVVVLADPAAAAYYGRVFDADWRGGRWRLPLGFAAGALLAAAVAVAALRRIVRFSDERADGVPGPGYSGS